MHNRQKNYEPILNSKLAVCHRRWWMPLQTALKHEYALFSVKWVKLFVHYTQSQCLSIKVYVDTAWSGQVITHFNFKNVKVEKKWLIMKIWIVVFLVQNISNYGITQLWFLQCYTKLTNDNYS